MMGSCPVARVGFKGWNSAIDKRSSVNGMPPTVNAIRVGSALLDKSFTIDNKIVLLNDYGQEIYFALMLK